MLTVVPLCESLVRGLALWRSLRGVPGVRLRLLVTKSRGPLPRRIAALARECLRLGPPDWRLVLALLRRGDLFVTLRPLPDRRNLDWIRAAEPDVGLHATSGIIYRAEVIGCFRRGILNPHIGILPEYRGRSVMEWSLLRGEATGVTTFFIDEGIDTGPEIVLRREVEVAGQPGVDAAKRYLYSLEGEMFAHALRRLQEPSYEPIRQRPDEGRRYYVMSDLFRGVVERLLAERAELVTSHVGTES